MSACGCPSSYPTGSGQVWHLHPVTCASCGREVRAAYPADGEHLCARCKPRHIHVYADERRGYCECGARRPLDEAQA